MATTWRTAICVVAAGWLLGPAHGAAADKRPNILLIVSEDNGPALGCYGEPTVRTPVLNQLAGEGVRFQHAYVTQAGCSQARASFLTGLYPHQNGQIGLATWTFRMYRDDTPNMVSLLRGAGYRTGMLGKLHVNPAAAFPLEYHEITGANFARNNLREYARRAAEFFALDERPFFLAVNYPDAHLPFLKQVEGLPAEPWQADDVRPLAYMGIDHPALREQTANYYNCMERLDRLVGDLLAELARSGQADNTLVVYIGDHGADMLRGKRTSYEGGLRIPMIARWPGQAVAGQTRDELVSIIDLLPTFLEAAGVAAPDGLPGESLAPLLRGESPPWREYLFAEFHTHSAHEYYPQRSVRNQRYKLIHNLLPGTTNPGYRYTLEHVATIDQRVVAAGTAQVRAAYARMENPPEFELYDLQADPHEWHNLANDARHADQLAELQTRLADWRRSTNDPLLDPANVRRLKVEIEACFVNGKADKSRLRLTYPDYFFASPAPHR